MVNEGLVDEPVFSFRLGSSEEDGGEAIFGGIDETAYTGKLDYVPVRRRAYWEVELEKVALGGDELELENTGAAIDTGQFFCTMTILSADRRSSIDRYLVDCPSHRYGRDAEHPNRCHQVVERPIHG